MKRAVPTMGDAVCHDKGHVGTGNDQQCQNGEQERHQGFGHGAAFRTCQGVMSPSRRTSTGIWRCNRSSGRNRDFSVSSASWASDPNPAVSPTFRDERECRVASDSRNCQFWINDETSGSISSRFCHRFCIQRFARTRRLRAAAQAVRPSAPLSAGPDIAGSFNCELSGWRKNRRRGLNAPLTTVTGGLCFTGVP